MTAGTDLHPEVREVVDRLVERLGDDLKAVLWHGSWARGEARPDSDHDLIIILKRVDDGVLLKLRDVFFGRASWSTLIQSEDELRHYPLAGRIQFTHGLRLLYGEFDGIELSREHLLEEIKSLAQWVRFECRHRLLHSDPEYEAMDRHLRGFHRARNLRMLFYAAKLAIVALKARELLEGRSYPTTRLELRQRLTDPDDVALVDLVEEWPLPRESYPGDVVDLALLLDRSTRRLVDWLETRDTRVSRRVSRVSKGPGGEVGP